MELYLHSPSRSSYIYIHYLQTAALCVCWFLWTVKARCLYLQFLHTSPQQMDYFQGFKDYWH
jgi:hypothetical protein